MLIKYKGNTSALLKDLSLELGNTVDLKTSEIILTSFFDSVLRQISIEENILLVSSLPPCLKPFCQKAKERDLLEPLKKPKVVMAVLKIVKKYAAAEKTQAIFSVFPPGILQEVHFNRKEVSIAA